MNLVSVRSLASRVSVITVRSVRFFLVFGCYRDVCPAVATKARFPVSISSIVGSSIVWAGSFGRYDSDSLGPRSDARVSSLRSVPPFGIFFVRSYRRGLVHSLGPIAVVSSTVGTRPSSDSCGLGRDNTDECSTSVAPALTLDP